MKFESTIHSEQKSFPFEIKRGYDSAQEIKERFQENGPVNFLVTRDYSIWLTLHSHTSLTDYGVESDDMNILGFVKMVGGKPEFNFYGETLYNRKESKGTEYKKEIERTILEFFET